MPSTNKTPNLQLNQWVGDDNIKIADLNADNAKIDAAIGDLQTNVYTKQESRNTFANAVRKTVSGAMLSLPDVQPGTEAAGFKIYGNTLETGTGEKSPDNPYTITGVGESGTIPITVSDGTNSQTVNIAVDKPLYSLPNGVRDELDVTGGRVVRRVGKTVLDGTESSWYINLPWDTQYVDVTHVHLNAGLPSWKVGQAHAICDKLGFFTEKTGRDLNAEQASCHTTNKAFTVQLVRSRIPEYTTELTGPQRADLFKTWLSANPITVLYELAKPVIETIPPIDIPLYYPHSTITCGDATEPEMEITYSRDINAAVAELQAAIVALGGT